MLDIEPVFENGLGKEFELLFSIEETPDFE